MSAAEKVFSIHELRILILSYAVDKDTKIIEKKNCKSSLSDKIDRVKYKIFRCFLKRMGIGVPVIF